MNKQTIIKSLL